MALLDNTDYRKPTDSRKTVRRMLAVLPALIVITVCYAVTVSAWFQASITSAGNTIKAATYDVSAEVTQNGIHIEPTAGVYSLESGKSYTVTLTAKGGASTGYCVVQTDAKTYCTDQIEQGKTLAFTLSPAQSGTYVFHAVWGSCPGTPDIKAGSEIKLAGAQENKPPEAPDNTNSLVSGGSADQETNQPAPDQQEKEQTSSDSVVSQTAGVHDSEASQPADTASHTPRELPITSTVGSVE